MRHFRTKHFVAAFLLAFAAFEIAGCVVYPAPVAVRAHYWGYWR